MEIKANEIIVSLGLIIDTEKAESAQSPGIMIRDTLRSRSEKTAAETIMKCKMMIEVEETWEKVAIN